jgi:hypothetical protein
MERRKRYLLEHVRFDYAIEVVDSDYLPVQIFVGPRGVSAGGVLRDVSEAVPGGNEIPWPPAAPQYCLTMSPRKGDTFLVAATYLRMRAGGCDSGDWGAHSADVLRSLYSMAHCALRQMGPRTRPYPNILGGKATLRWRSADETRKALERISDDYVGECRAFVKAIDGPVWTNTELLSRIVITVSDRRGEHSIPIPYLGGVMHLAPIR